MTERIFIKPAPQAEGQPPLKVRKPVNGHLAEQGESVNLDSYWQRRLKDGDVVVAEEQVAEPDAAKPRGGKSA